MIHFISAIAAAILLAGAVAGCTLTQGQQMRLDGARSLPGRPDSLTVAGLVYDDAQCLQEAAESFRQALRFVGTAESAQRTEADGMLQFVRAEQTLAAGNLAEAITGLWAIVTRVRSPNAFSRATMRLAEVLPASDIRGWDRLTEYLSEVSHRLQDWGALFRVYRIQYQRNPAAATEAVEQELAGAGAPLRRAACQILLAEFYFRSGRAAEAEILLNSIEEDVGLTVTDIPLRRRFLELGKQVWQSASRTDPRQRERADAYARLLADFDARAAKIL
jgi:hypothetical protein